jgi:hypothetical protein
MVNGRIGVIDRRWRKNWRTGGIEIVTSATSRGGDTANAGRFLVRALVVIGGAAAVSAIAWLSATASASTVTPATDEPIGSSASAVVTAIGEPPVLSRVAGSVPVARDAATPALARVRDLSGAAAHTVPLADVLETSTNILAGAATDLTGLVVPADSPSDHISPAGPDVEASNHLTRAPANSSLRERPAGHASAAIPVRAVLPEIAGQPDTDHPSAHGAGGPAGGSWLPSCVVPASAGLTAGHDRGCGDAVETSEAEHTQPSHRRNDVLSRAVTSVEIQPGVTPD